MLKWICPSRPLCDVINQIFIDLLIHLLILKHELGQLFNKWCDFLLCTSHHSRPKPLIPHIF